MSENRKTKTLHEEDPRILRLELDIDERLVELWAEVDNVSNWDISALAIFMRAAYGKGYVDALKELPEDKGKLNKDHGYPLPHPTPFPLDPEV